MAKQWQQRVVQERAELKDKYIKLGHFLDTATQLDPVQLNLLRDQSAVMAEYLMILDRRMETWQK